LNLQSATATKNTMSSGFWVLPRDTSLFCILMLSRREHYSKEIKRR
jgi:hypothetical protein